MTFFENMRFAAKVAVAFGLVLLVTMALGLYAMQRLAGVNAAALDMRDNWLPATRALGEVAALAERHRALLSDLMMAETAAQRRPIRQRIDTSLELRDGAWKRYEATVVTAQERALADAIGQAWQVYLVHADNAARARAAGDLDLARTQYDDAVQDFRLLREAIDRDLEFNAQEGTTAGDQAAAIYAAAQTGIAVALALAALLCVASGLLIVFGMSRPVARLTEAMRVLAKNDMTAAVPGIGRGDEIGAMATAVQVFKDSMIEADRLRALQAAEQQKQLDRARTIEEGVAEFESAVAGIVSMVAAASTELKSTAQSMSATAAETTGQAATVASSSEQATVSVQGVSAATEELSVSISEISRQITHSAELIHEAAGRADLSSDQVRGLSDTAERIGGVVTLIADIAGQTNLLALNATIEAARAGDAGKGFAVVASEVKALAKQTALATDEIAAQIKAIQQATRESATSILEVASMIGQVRDTATMIASAVEEQGVATQEIARNVQEAAQGTIAVANSIVAVSDAARETGKAADHVLSAAGELSANGEVLQSKVGAFLAHMRAA